MRHRQEVLNVKLADLLCDEGLVADPETIVSAASHRQMPDVLVDFRGLRMAIEGDFADKPNVEDTVLHQASHRVETSVAHIGIAVIYPESLRSVSFADWAVFIIGYSPRQSTSVPITLPSLLPHFCSN